MGELVFGPSGPVAALVLASASPRRVELLERLGLSPDVVPAEVDESVRADEDSVDYVVRLANAKATAVAAVRPDALVIGADTAVVLGDGPSEEILGKPADAVEALRTLERLAGRTHRVITAVAVAVPGDGLRSDVDTAFVTIASMTDAERDWYVATGEPFDKAGAYGLQGRGAVLVDRVEGDPTTVIGLPLRRTAALLRASGFDWP